MNNTTLLRIGIVGALLAVLGLRSASVESDTVYFAGTPAAVAQVPLYIKDSVPPLNMLVLGKDHKIYYEAYNDAGDLNGDGIPDVGYKPAQIDYYGYFNSNGCYNYDAGTGKFTPSSYTANKQCAGKWSGDFLNYVTTSRMDALRRVLYGGWRQTDTANETVLQGAFFPQDAHSWGKEYKDSARDGYDISKYTPLGAPEAGKYHLFAVTTLADNTAPLMRVMQSSSARVWNWLSIEGPVAGNKCFTSTNDRVDCLAGGVQAFPGHPATRAAFDAIESSYAATSQYLFGSGSATNISCTSNACNPYGADDNYLSIFEGAFHVGNGNGNQGFYQFAVDGDDAVDFVISQSNGSAIAGGQAGYYGGHGACNCETYATGAIYMNRGDDYKIRFRHEDQTGGDQYLLKMRFRATTLLPWGAWQTVPGGNGNGNTGLRDLTLSTYNLTPTINGATRNDYEVRVQVCPDDANLRNGDTSCKAYPNGKFKPTGILHEYGEPRKMYFGLISGSQPNNLEGGVLRRNISDFNDEIIPGTGVFKTNVAGIANTISRFRMIGGGYNNGTTNNSGSDSNWNWANTTNGSTGNCPSVGNRSINNGECRMWGNPIGEMLYESMRYFSGADKTPRFSAAGGDGTTEETKLGISQEDWKDPYKAAGADGLGFATCAAPVQTIISDINPSYDGDMPNSAFSGAIKTTGSKTPTEISGFNPENEGQAMWTAEGLGTRSVFIGEVNGVTDGAPTAKAASSLGNIRGLSPEEPTKGGTYYSASVARFAFNHDINAASGAQNIATYSIALASPLPKIELPNGISILPFGKTGSGTFGNGDQAHKPTNTIVDFYVQQYENFPGQTVKPGTNGGLPYAIFRINYEDVEQGNDHDMDAIVLYEIKGLSGGSVEVNLTSEYAAGSADQNIGYVISGSNKDGIYLVVRDTDSTAATFSRYDLNTPPDIDPGGCKGVATGVCNQQLPTESKRTFSAGTNTATRLKDPLWFAAKYGNPSTATGVPANYFLVTNPLNLRDQLRQAFDNIADAPVDIGNTSISGARVGNSSFTLLPSYAARRNRKDWTGNLKATAVNADGSLGAALWEAQASLPLAASRNIRTITTAGDGTNHPTTGIKAKDFQTGNLSFSALGITGNVQDVYGTNYPLDDMVKYLRGDQSHEASKATTGNTLRTRSAVLGDIVNSEPVIASPKSNFGYGYYTDTMFTGYSTVGGYLTDKANRKAVAYVGANDGMLHAFDSSTEPCANDSAKTCAKAGAGKELFAFVPNGVLDGMGELPKPDSRFAHRYFVDGQMTVTDAKDGGTWKTLLVGSAGAGGRSVFVLNVGNPDTFTEANVLWERNSKVDLDIGNVYGKPLLVPLENDKWGVLFGNGYGGNLSDPSLYILDAFTGRKIAKITANDGKPGQTSFLVGLMCSLTDFLIPNFPGCARATDPYNGLGQITSIDKDGNGKVDTVYGGDLQGNLWKFDLSNGDEGNWKVANSGKALFQTQVSTNASSQQQYQPITGGIRVAAGPGSGAMIYFGTGRYFVTGDNDVVKSPQVPQLQSLYAFFDNGITANQLTIADLQRQTVTSQQTTGAYTTRNISTEPVFYYGANAKRGWYLDLKVNTSAVNDGERFIATPLVQSGRVFFTTYTPKEDSCNPGGTNFQYGLDLLSGTGSLGNVQLLGTGTVACANGDCGAAAIVTKGGSATQAPVMGVGVAAINPLVQIDPACDPTKESCAGFTQCQVVIYPGGFVLPRPCGRQSWRQLK